jgi:hypothetical protein
MATAKFAVRWSKREQLMTNLKSLVNIRDPDINLDEVLLRLRARLQERRAKAQAQGLDYDCLSDQNLEGEGVRLFSATLSADLEQVYRTAENLWISVKVRDEKLPLINRWWNRFKEAFHLLVVMYVNMLAGQQIMFNMASARLLDDLLQVLEEREARLRALEVDVATLQERVNGLKEKGGLHSFSRPDN